MAVYVDPPSGWKYGFPKALPDGIIDLRKWLLEEGYPEEDIDFALKYIRTWTDEEY
jgi:hypothetical protein